MAFKSIFLIQTKTLLNQFRSRSARTCLSFFLSFLLILPPQLFAAPRSSQEPPPSHLDPSSLPLSSAQAFRWIDPFFVGSQKIYIREENKKKAYDFWSANDSYQKPTFHYDLDQDVKMTYQKNRVSFLLQKNSGQRLKIQYEHTFKIPHVIAIAKDCQHAYALTQEGILYAFLMAHTKLFQANDFAGGSPLLVLPIGMIPQTSKPQELKIFQGHDLENLSHLSEKEKRHLYIGDLLIGSEKKDGSFQVQKIISYPAILNLQLQWISFLKIKNTLIQNRENFSAWLQIQKKLFFQQKTNPFLKIAPLPISAALGRFLRPFKKEWDQHPFQITELTSPVLEETEYFLKQSIYETRSPTYRASFQKKVPFFQSLSLPKNSIQKHVLSNRLWSLQTLLGFSSLGKKMAFLFHKKLAHPLLALFSVWTFTSFSPSPTACIDFLFHAFSYVFPIAIFDTTHQVRLFRIGSVTGPMVPYGLKFTILASAFAFLVLSLPYLAARWDKKVLNRALPKATLKERRESGYRVLFTLSLRLGSYVMTSLRGILIKTLLGKKYLQKWRYGIFQHPSSFSPSTAQNTVSDSVLKTLGHTYAIALLSFDLVHSLLEKQIYTRFPDLPDPTQKPTLFWERFLQTLSTKKKENFLNRTSLLLKEARVFLSEQKLPSVLKTSFISSLEEGFSKTPSVQEQISRLFQKLNFHELLQVQELYKKKSFRNFIAKIVGNDATALDLRHEEIDKNLSADFMGPMSIESAMIYFFHGTGMSQYNNFQHPDPEMLAAGDRGICFGIAGEKPIAGASCGALKSIYSNPYFNKVTYEKKGIISHTTQSVLSDSYLNSELDPLRSQLIQRIQQTQPQSFRKSWEKYKKGFQGFYFYMGYKKLGETITRSQWKSYKFWGSLSLAFFLLSYLRDHALELTSWSTFAKGVFFSFSSSIYLTFLLRFYSYSTFNVLWNFHRYGTKLSQEHTRVFQTKWLRLILALGFWTERLETDPDAKKQLKKQIKKIEILYQRYEKPLPWSDLSSTASLEKKAHILAGWALTHPPKPLLENARFPWILSLGLSMFISVLAVPGFSMAWQWAAQIPVWVFLSIATLHYTFAWNIQKFALKKMRLYFQKELEAFEKQHVLLRAYLLENKSNLKLEKNFALQFEHLISLAQELDLPIPTQFLLEAPATSLALEDLSKLASQLLHVAEQKWKIMPQSSKHFSSSSLEQASCERLLNPPTF